MPHRSQPGQKTFAIAAAEFPFEPKSGKLINSNNNERFPGTTGFQEKLTRLGSAVIRGT